jgi:hypothetical protein
VAVPAPSYERFDQSSSSLELDELFELELDEPLELEFEELFEFELDELFELEFEELFELEFEELFELEFDELFEFELDELLELELEEELDEPLLPTLLHQPSSSATRTNPSCWFVTEPLGADPARCAEVSSIRSTCRAWAAPLVPSISPRAAVVSHVILLMGGLSLMISPILSDGASPIRGGGTASGPRRPTCKVYSQEMKPAQDVH